MRLLFLTNFYPPLHRGGYEQWCQEIAHTLHAQGHQTAILTSRYRLAELPHPDPAGIHRTLHLETKISPLANSYRFFIGRQRREASNLAHLNQLCHNFQPEAIIVWGMWNLSWSLPARLEQLYPGRVIYYIGDYWLTLPSQTHTYWHTPGGPLTKLPKALLGTIARRQLARQTRPTLRLTHGLFPTPFMRHKLNQDNITFTHSAIIPGAIDTSRFTYHTRPQANPLRLLYLGRLHPDKGVHTAITAFIHLLQTHNPNDFKLTLIGQGEPSYLAELKTLAHPAGTAITFSGALPPQHIPALLQQADILLFTSIWPEPFGRVIVEAMASGTTVIGTATGGAGEILRHGENGLVFPAGNAPALAQHIHHLHQNPTHRIQLAQQAQQTITPFDIKNMAAGIITYLQTQLDL